jgi:nifR3 family TIM-barrel protein
MVKIEALVRHDTNSYKLLDYDDSMHPIGAQLCGSNIKYAKKAAAILEDLGVDWIDFNCGCPVDKVTKDGSGSAMLKTPTLIGEMLTEFISAVKVPVSVKIRIGWDDTNINAVEILKIAEKAGADVIFIHGRTRAQGYTGKSNRDVIKECKDNATKIKVFGNGDLFDVASVSHMFNHTKCDGVLLARGMLAQPWLAQNIADYYKNDHATKFCVDLKEEILKHYAYICDYCIERKALLDMRRVTCFYLQRYEGAKKLRLAVNNAKSSSELFAIIQEFNWEQLKLKQ